MKIGIITFHLAYNYGAVLQCYALQEYLKRIGHDVFVINYKQQWIDGCFKTFSLIKLKYNFRHPKLMTRYLLTSFIRYRTLKKKRLVFTAFVEKFFNLTDVFEDKMKIPQDFDAYVIGSDQVWSLHVLGDEFDDIFIGNFPHRLTSKIIGYAISTDKQSIKSLSDKEMLKKCVNNFYAISFRESSIAHYVSTKLQIEVPICLDPTLLSDSNIWNQMINCSWAKKKYIVVYQVRGVKKFLNPIYLQARKIANSIGRDCEIIDLSDMSYSVEDFVSIIKYARFVMTSSFHATVFSIIFKTPLCVFKLNDGKDDRYVNLLHSLHLDELCKDIGSNVEYYEPDYSHLDEILKKLRNDSTKFFDNNLR